jgi:YHYH protein
MEVRMFNKQISLTAALVVASLAQPVYADAEVSTIPGLNLVKWAANIRLTISPDSFHFASNGLPNHDHAAQYLVPKPDNPPPFGSDPVDTFTIVNASDFLRPTPIDIEITTHPTYSQTTTPTNMGMIGVIISGARLFNDYEDPSRLTAALDDNRRIGSAVFVDDCNAHPLQTGSHYHYHGVPLCLMTASVQGGHSPIIGMLLDGFPVYGNKGSNGIPMTNADLDECSGHYGPTPEFPSGIYHYHLTTDKAPYSIDCYHGTIAASLTREEPPK